jgi:predicted outer membrane protein
MGLTLAALVYPSMLGLSTVANSQSRIVAQTSAGPLTEADRDFVVKVRSAGLWEYPVGQMALRKGTTKAVLTAGQHLVDGHAARDAACRRIAPQLGITLPNQPTPQQQGFVAQLNSDSGRQFDSDMANILRVTHGQIFSTIAKIRATTRNTLVRQLADQANDTVLDHITVMEKTGLVDFDQVLVQETIPPKLSANDLTPPPPQPGQPQVVLTPPANSTNTPTASPSP